MMHIFLYLGPKPSVMFNQKILEVFPLRLEKGKDAYSLHLLNFFFPRDYNQHKFKKKKNQFIGNGKEEIKLFADDTVYPENLRKSMINSQAIKSTLSF